MRLKNITLITFLSLLFTSGLFAQTFYTEDFDGGLPADWTSTEVAGDATATSVWVHTTTGPAGTFAIDPIASTSAANGWMMFDSDLNCSGNQDAWIISPEIDATDKAEVWLQFESYYRSFSDRPQIRIGTDMNDLSSWDTLEVFPGVTANSFAPENDPDINPQTVNVNLTANTAGTVFRFAFQYLSDGTTDNGGGAGGCAYAWELDDVSLTDISPLPAIDMRVNGFHAIPPNAITPASQLEAITFMADIENVGSGDVNASTLDINIADQLGNQVFTDQLSYPAVPAGMTNENVFFPNPFTPVDQAEIYQGTYVITPLDGADGATENNEQSFIFEVSDTLFSKNRQPTRGVAPGGDGNEAYTYGNIYYVPNGAGMFARYVQFGSRNASDHVGESVVIYLYRWAGDTNGDGALNAAEFIPGADGSPFQTFSEYTFDGTEDDVLLNIPISLEGEGVPLEDDSYYYVCIEYGGTTDFFLLASEEYDYASMQFVTDSLEMPRYASALDVTNTGDFGITGFGPDIVPMVNMSIGDNPDIHGPALINDATKETILAAGTLNVFPNPVDKTATIEFNLTETSDKVTLDLFNAAGKLVRTSQFENVLNDKVTMNVADLANGTYMLRARTNKGIRTINVTIQH